MTTVLDLSKKFELNLEKAGFTKIPTMQTRLAVDKSGSMSDLYDQGFVETAIELFLGAAAKFDDNGELEYTFFNTSATKVKSVGVNNYKSLSIPSPNSGTNYVPALEELVASKPAATGFFSKVFGGGGSPESGDPVYVGFITDGDPSDLSESLAYMNSLKGTRNFVQFIVLGNGVRTSTMQELTRHPNADYCVIKNPSNMTVDELYEAIANKKLLEWTKSL